MSSAVAAVILTALAFQLAALRGMGRNRPIGDEKAYLARGRSEDPYAPRQFLRPPLLPWLSAVFCRGGDGMSRLRLLMAIASFLAVVLTAVAGWRLGGPAIAVLAALLLAAQPERILIGCHIWPESLLALLLAALCAVHTLPATPAVALAAAGISTLGVLTRIDFAVVPPLLLAAWWQSHGMSALIAALLLAPPAIALLWISVRNGRRYGVPLPDTTWAFNLMLARREYDRAGSRAAEIEQTIQGLRKTWLPLSPAQSVRRGQAALSELLRSPAGLVRGIARRLLALAGPDTFVRQRMLPTYVDLSPPARRRWNAVLKVAFPLQMTTLLIATAVTLEPPPSCAWPAFGLLAAAALFHARTRYRVSVLPALSLWAAQALAGLAESLPGRPATAAAAAIGGALLFWALLRVRTSTEVGDSGHRGYTAVRPCNDGPEPPPTERRGARRYARSPGNNPSNRHRT